MALHALAQCTVWLLLAHQQKHGRQQAGISSHDNEEERVRKDWSRYCALADLGMEERVKGGWCVRVLRPLRYQLIVLLLSCDLRHSCLLSKLHGVEPYRATQAAYRAFTQGFVAPPDTVQQKKLDKLLKRPLPKEDADALFTYEGFLYDLGCVSLNA